MKITKVVLMLISFSVYSHGTENVPQVSEYQVKTYNGPFEKKLKITHEFLNHSNKWKQLMQKELQKEVNFSGHYRVYLSRNGEFPKECGDRAWVCGWIIDKLTGEIISQLPSFNNNTKYYATINNGTRSPDLFSTEFYARSNLMWISGQNHPEHGKFGLHEHCANVAYEFKENKFTKLFSGLCERDVGEDQEAEHFLP